MTQKPLILAVETSSRTGSVAIAIGEKMLAETVFSGPAQHSRELFPVIQQLLDRFKRKSNEIEYVYISIGPGSFTGLRIATTLAKMMHLANLPIGTKIVTVDSLDVIAANIMDYIKEKSKSTLCGSARLNPSKLALGEEFPKRIATILDAKRNQFFIAVYEYNPNLDCRQTSTINNTSQDQQTNTTEHCIGFVRQVGSHQPLGGWEKILPDTLITAEQFIERFARNDKSIWLLGDGLLYHTDKFKTDPQKQIQFLDRKFWSPQAGKVHLLGWQKALAGLFSDPVTLTPNYIHWAVNM
jgi:tRNA threonylcarbamoyl adenosine modification protein YeaZ